MGSDSEAELKVDYSAKLTPTERKRLKKQRKEEKSLKRLKKDEQAKLEEISAKEQEDSKSSKQSTTEDKDSKGRAYTVSIAVAGSILDNAQSPSLRAYLAGQIARAAAIFNVDEVIVFDDSGGKCAAACEQLAMILQFMECPQYLRKYLFPLHDDLKFAGVMSPLDIPHHLRKDEVLPYREGIVANRPHKEGKGSYIYVGLEKDVSVDKSLDENTRVTVKLDNPDLLLSKKGKLRGTLVSPHQPRIKAGIYWGYSVRIANSLSQVFSQCPFKNGYDVTIGTSEKGTPVSQLKIKPFTRLLVVFGGVEGLEYAFDNDESSNVEDVSKLFHHYVNTCPFQGSRTIRTEEAILISLTAFNNVIAECQKI